jgi:hypothetical protein
MTKKSPPPINEPYHPDFGIPNEDYEELRELLKKYDPNISLEQAKGVGDFWLRMHSIMNKPSVKNQDNGNAGGKNETS